MKPRRLRTLVDSVVFRIALGRSRWQLAGAVIECERFVVMAALPVEWKRAKPAYFETSR